MVYRNFGLLYTSFRGQSHSYSVTCIRYCLFVSCFLLSRPHHVCLDAVIINDPGRATLFHLPGGMRPCMAVRQATLQKASLAPSLTPRVALSRASSFMMPGFQRTQDCKSQDDLDDVQTSSLSLKGSIDALKKSPKQLSISYYLYDIGCTEVELRAKFGTQI